MQKRRTSAPRVAAGLVLLFGVAAFLVVGCSKENRSALTGPSGAATASTQTLLARNPADLAATMRVQNAHTPDLMKIPGVVGTGTGALPDGRAAVLVLTREPGVGGIPRTLDGLPVDVRVVGDVHAYPGNGGGHGGGGGGGGGGGTIQCGTSTGRDDECAAGTIGCVVTKGSSQYFLSNNHVFAAENAGRSGDRIDAPGRYDAKPKCAQTPQLGTLASFVSINFSGGSNTVDCALAAPSSGVSYTTAEAGGYTPTSNVVSPSVGLAVKKTGRTSGLTHDTIQAINVTITVGYSSGTATFVNQIMCSGSFIRSGDSGSLMVTESGNDPVGLCFAGGAGGSFANPIGPVLQALGATVAQ